MLHDVQRGIERFQLLIRGVKLLAADVRRRVNDLALQIACIHHIEVHQTQRAYACSGEIERQRRAKTACAHA